MVLMQFVWLWQQEVFLFLDWCYFPMVNLWDFTESLHFMVFNRTLQWYNNRNLKRENQQPTAFLEPAFLVDFLTKATGRGRVDVIVVVGPLQQIPRWRVTCSRSSALWLQASKCGLELNNIKNYRTLTSVYSNGVHDSLHTGPSSCPFHPGSSQYAAAVSMSGVCLSCFQDGYISLISFCLLVVVAPKIKTNKNNSHPPASETCTVYYTMVACLI